MRKKRASLTDAKRDAGESGRRENEAFVVGEFLDVNLPRRRRRHRLSSVRHASFRVDHEEDDQQDGEQPHERGHPKAPAPVAETRSNTWAK
jgi:hypothetical protein